MEHTSTDTFGLGSAPLIEARNLCVGHSRRPVVSGLNVAFPRGISAIVGRNGSGKSTLIRTLATVITPLAGEVDICGTPASGRSLRAARRHLGYVPQAPRFPDNFTVSELIEYTAMIQGVPPTGAAQTELCRAFDLDPLARTRIGHLSGGQRQRVLLAQALLHEPSVLLLDEPTTGLDIPARAELAQHLRAIGRTRGVILSTHLTNDLTELADHVLLIANGRASMLDSFHELRSQGEGSLHETVAAMLSDDTVTT